MGQKKTELKDEMTEQVNGGYFYETHALSEGDYNACDIKTDYHWIKEDEFWLPDGKKVSEADANNYIISTKGQDEFDKLAAGKNRKGHKIL